MSEKYYVDEDEWWPVYSLVKVEGGRGVGSQDYPFEPAQEFIDRCERVFKEFNELQQELKKLLELQIK